jgi:hypothetical protein
MALTARVAAGTEVRDNFVIILAQKEPDNDPTICSTSCSGRASLCPSTDGAFMDRTATDQTIKVLLSEIHRRLDDAARIAKAAEACALAGSVAEGVSVSMDIEQLIYEAGRLQDAASLLNRLARE